METHFPWRISMAGITRDLQLSRRRHVASFPRDTAFRWELIRKSHHSMSQLEISKGAGGGVCKPLSARCACLSVVLGAPSQRSVSNGRRSCFEDERCWKGWRRYGCPLHPVSLLVALHRNEPTSTGDRLGRPHNAVNSVAKNSATFF